MALNAYSPNEHYLLIPVQTMTIQEYNTAILWKMGMFAVVGFPFIFGMGTVLVMNDASYLGYPIIGIGGALACCYTKVFYDYVFKPKYGASC